MGRILRILGQGKLKSTDRRTNSYTEFLFVEYVIERNKLIYIYDFVDVKMKHILDFLRWFLSILIHFVMDILAYNDLMSLFIIMYCIHWSKSAECLMCLLQMVTRNGVWILVIALAKMCDALLILDKMDLVIL